MQPSRLARRLNLSDAIFLGLGSMIGAGIFAVAGPAAQAAGSGLLLALIIAGFLAFCNATSMAQLSRIYPESGGTYVYGRKQLSPFWGFLAGWGFIIGKIASCSAMALTFSYYTFPEHPKITALILVLIITFINYLGVKKTAHATKVLATIVITILFILVVALLWQQNPQVGRLTGWFKHAGLQGVLEASGLMFFAFAGYARIATLGEEVIDPQKNIPKAILYALSFTIFLYFLIIGTTLLTLPIEKVMSSKAPLVTALEGSSFYFLKPIIRIGAAIASMSVLLSLVAGISRTVFAMASNKDLPRFLNAVHPHYKVPHHAELTVGLIISILVLIADLRLAIGFSSCAILTYYAIANLSALKISYDQRLYPSFFTYCGLFTCLILIINLPRQSLFGGVMLFVLGSLFYFLRRRFC